MASGAGSLIVELTVQEMAKLLRVPLIGKPKRGHVEICSDSRTFRAGQVFWALKGPNFDGHAFVEESFNKGGVAAVVEREWYEQNGRPARVYVPVGDTQQALTSLAKSYAARFRIPKIAITGSNGKTTTKDMIAAVLRRAGKTLATEGNFNNHIGVPLTLFGLRKTHRYAVLEMGTNHPGEIALLSETARPTLAVVTNIGWSHLENFGTKEAIRDEKLTIIAGFSRPGTLFLNVDDPLLCDFRPGPRCKLMTFGIHRGQIRPDDLKLGPDGCASFRIGRTPFRLTVPGLHNVYNALAAVSVGLHLRIPKSEAAAALASFAPPKFRMQVKRVGSLVILDDCYNANPSSMRSALSTLAAYQSEGRRIAVLGDMLELGVDSERLHTETGHFLMEMGVQELYTFGSMSRHINQGARDKGLPRQNAHHFSDFDLMLNELAADLRPGDVVLVKASRGMRLERVHETLRALAGAGTLSWGNVK
jgi:UDP-N-acetylmuramoyl-tripeptide--D-alanyl-D-alanine ligase